MFEVPSIADLNLGLTLPALTLALGACILLLVDALFIPKDKKIRTAWLALIGIGASFTINLFTFNQSGTAFLGMFAADGFTSLAVVAGALGVAAGFPLADPAIGLVITLAILRIVWQAGGQVLSRLMDGGKESGE